MGIWEFTLGQTSWGGGRGVASQSRKNALSWLCLDTSGMLVSYQLVIRLNKTCLQTWALHKPTISNTQNSACYSHYFSLRALRTWSEFCSSAFSQELSSSRWHKSEGVSLATIAALVPLLHLSLLLARGEGPGLPVNCSFPSPPPPPAGLRACAVGGGASPRLPAGDDGAFGGLSPLCSLDVRSTRSPGVPRLELCPGFSQGRMWPEGLPLVVEGKRDSRRMAKVCCEVAREGSSPTGVVARGWMAGSSVLCSVDPTPGGCLSASAEPSPARQRRPSPSAPPKWMHVFPALLSSHRAPVLLLVLSKALNVPRHQEIPGPLTPRPGLDYHRSDKVGVHTVSLHLDPATHSRQETEREFFADLITHHYFIHYQDHKTLSFIGITDQRII